MVVLPIWMPFIDKVAEADRLKNTALWWGMAIIDFVIIQVCFWEKFFAVLTVTEDEIRWKCPLRKTRIIPVSKCAEIGAYVENADNGIPTEQIYICDYANPQQHMGKNGVMKGSAHLIKFWYTSELCNYLLQTMPDTKTHSLAAYKAQRKEY